MELPEAAVARLFGGRADVAVSPLDFGLGDLLPEERARVERAAPKRQREFAAGRVCAHRLLRARGIADAPLLPDDERATLWPQGIVGSISHSSGLCVVAIAATGELAALGLDLERDDAVRPAVWRRICGAAEVERLRAAPESERARLASLIFSAKEATYKCLFPLSRVELGFKQVEIEIDAATQRFRATLLRATSPLAAEGDVLQGRYAEHPPWVVTALAIPAARSAS
ncbi:MAG: 4'-phosphopantetheinyl transferase superfamily protein [Deltaproteobacteria bacterium]|nr:4'-phosphopantetheinyl transferase superfamily protein [Deltaproteobacteria bacterium]MBW2415410.1 4'-phosphopantetheinyl transferase superfamily protein [Deltaproteobacteria bacterium]